MAASETPEAMSDEGRGLLTAAEKEILSGEREVTDNYEYKVESLVRNRVKKNFESDVRVLREHFPEVYETIHEMVCGGPPTNGDGIREPAQARVRKLEERNNDLRDRLAASRSAADVDPETARHALADLEHAFERGDRREAEAALERARAALEVDFDCLRETTDYGGDSS